MILMIKKVQKLTTILLLWISLPTFLLLTNPETLPIPLLIMPFLMVLFAIYRTTNLALGLGPRPMSPKRAKLMSGVIAILPTVLLILASIGQLTVRDSVIIFGLLILLTFYMRRLDFLNI